MDELKRRELDVLFVGHPALEMLVEDADGEPAQVDAITGKLQGPRFEACTSQQPVTFFVLDGGSQTGNRVSRRGLEDWHP